MGSWTKVIVLVVLIVACQKLFANPLDVYNSIDPNSNQVNAMPGLERAIGNNPGRGGNPNVAPVPLPASVYLFGAGFAALALRRAKS